MHIPHAQIARPRSWAIRWLYAVALVHLVGGFMLPWIATLPLLDGYYLSVEHAFWPELAPAAARAQQAWWMGLFGPTLQASAVWMAALIRTGERTREPLVWVALIAGIAVWAPQDVALSLRADAWVHVWIDGAAVLAIAPPLAWLWWRDQRQRAQCSPGHSIPERGQ